MSTSIAGLPFPVTPSPPEAWSIDAGQGVIVGDAPAHTDLYVNPGGIDSADADSLLNAATLLGNPAAG